MQSLDLSSDDDLGRSSSSSATTTMPSNSACSNVSSNEISMLFKSPPIRFGSIIIHDCVYTHMQKYTVLNKNKHNLGGLLAIKRSGLSDATKLLNYYAVQKFKNEPLFTEDDELAYLMTVEYGELEDDGLLRK